MINNFFFKDKGTEPGTVLYEGDTPPTPTSICFYKIYSNKVDSYEDISNVNEDKGLLWIRVSGLKDTERILKTIEKYQINKLTLEDIFETYHSPKFDDTFDYTFIIMRSVNIGGERLKDNQLSFILLDNTLITFEEYKCEEVDIVLQRLLKHYDNFFKRGIGYLLYALVDSLMDSYLLTLNNINMSVDILEDSMSNDVSIPIDLSSLFKLKRKVNFLHRHTRSSYEVINNLLKSSMELKAAHKEDISPYYEDVFEHTVYLSESIQYCKDSIRSLYDENMSRIQVRSNKFINILTMFSTIMLPPMVIGGIFGMNFENIPGTNAHNGFFISIIAMGLISLFIALYFKWKKYL